jgi:hypothetical protein
MMRILHPEQRSCGILDCGNILNQKEHPEKYTFREKYSDRLEKAKL